jgi:outer membrane receptor protein involved in Fe transport
LGLQPLQFLPPFLNYPNSVENGTSKDDKTTWMARVSFAATDEINVYASAGTGFKATSWNLSRDSRPFQADLPAILAAGLAVNNLTAGTRYAGPEEAMVYELGMKGAWSTFQLNLSLFDQEIEGFQSNTFTGTGFNLANAGKQSTLGVEIDSTWLPIDSLRLGFAATWLDPEYDSFVGGSGVNGVEDLSGTTPAGIPEFAMVASGTWYFDLFSAEGYLRGEYVYESEVQVIENVPEEIASREVNMFNASVGLAWSNGFEVGLYGRNLTDDEFLQSAFPAVAQAGSYSGYPNQPATYGVTLRKRF